MKKDREIAFCIIGLVLCGFALFSCSDTPTNSKLTHTYQQLSEALNSAYEQNSQSQLDAFFDKWNEIIPPHNPQEVSAFSDTVAEAYRVFQEFYSPAELSRLTHGEHENFETDFRYIAVQNQLRVAVADTNPEYYYYQGVNLSELKVEDFRPKISNEKYPSVYLSQKADSVIFHFLFKPDSTYTDDHENRVDFLRQAIQLTHHHWIPDFHKYTMPHASSIIFNEPLTKALVQFRVFYQFGDAHFEKSNGNWTLISSKLTAIE